MKTQHNAPLFPLLICLSGGIFFAAVTALFIYPLCLFLFGLLFLAEMLPRTKMLLWLDRSKQVCWLAFFVILGMARMHMTHLFPQRPELEEVNCQEVECVGTLLKPSYRNQFGQKSWLELNACQIDGEWVRMYGRIQLFFPKGDSQSYKKYQHIHYSGWQTSLYSAYPSYLDYLRKKGLSHSVYAKQIKVVGHARGILPWAYSLQQGLASKLDQLFSDSSHIQLMKAMMLGEKQGLDRQLRLEFTQAGISHILAISGMHIGIIFLILDKLLAFLSYFPRGYQLKQTIILLLLLVFMFITGAKPAVVRACLMLGAILLARMTYQRYQSLNILSLTGIVQLLVSPALIWDIGFQLSYLAVIALVVLYPRWEGWLRTGVFWKDALLGWIGVSLIATAVTCPLIFSVFGRFPTYFLLSNLLISLPVCILLWMGFLTIGFCWVPGLNMGLAMLCEVAIDLCIWIVDWVVRLPYGEIMAQTTFWEGWHILLIELSLGGILVWGLSKAKLNRRGAKGLLLKPF